MDDSTVVASDCLLDLFFRGHREFRGELTWVSFHSWEFLEPKFTSRLPTITALKALAH